MSHYDWLEVRPGQVWAEWTGNGYWDHFKVLRVSSDRAKVFWPAIRGGKHSTKRLSAFRLCKLIQDVPKGVSDD